MIPVAEPLIGAEELRNVVEAVKSGWVSSKGKFISEFEQGFAEYVGVDHAVATANGTVSLHLILSALGIGKGDEVIVPSLTFIATANSVRYCNANPVFVDSDPNYWCINPEKIEEKITEKTKAIIPVHLYGHPCDMDRINKIAREYDLFVLEDAAEAHGAEYKSRKVGSLGDASSFSFYGNKIMTTGEGGMALTRDSKLADRMRLLRDHGMSPNKRYWHEVVGYNYRMTNLQAAIGLAQLEKIRVLVDRRRDIANSYRERLEPLQRKGLLELHPEASWSKCVFWLYSILVTENTPLTRDGLSRSLLENGVETRPFFTPVHTMPPYFIKQGPKCAEDLSGRGLCLPSSATLENEDLDFIVTLILRELAGARR